MTIADLPDAETPPAEEAAPPNVMSFNATEPTGAAGLGADQAAMVAMGAHPLPVVTSVLIRDTAEVFEHHALDDEIVSEQARSVLEDMPTSAWKVGFLGNAETVSAVAEILSDYPDLPLVTYVGATSWLDDEQQQSYQDALRELVLPQTLVLVGNHAVLTEFLLPEWDADRPASPRELAVAAHKLGAAHTLVTGISLPNQHIDNVLAGPQGPITGEKFERFEASFIGAGDTLSAALAALLAAGVELHEAVGEALTFLDQALDAGFQGGMGHVIPDRFFWALPPPEEGDVDADLPTPPTDDTPPPPRRMH
jgi:hydroxymethylpyrimidine/phosphomethylpyrimidine kinase